MISLRDKIAAKLGTQNKTTENPTVAQCINDSITQTNQQVKINLPKKLSVPITVNANQSHSPSDSQLAKTSQVAIPTINDSDIGRILNNIESLRVAIHEVHPNMPQLLSTIWKQLKDTPDCVTILKPEEIAVIVQGAEIHANVKISEGITKPRASKKKVLTVDDV